MTVFPPGGNRSWLEVLPEDYRDNPEVIVVMAPSGSRGTVEETHDGAHIGVLTTPRGTRRCLQVIDPPLVSWIEHQAVAESYGLQMAQPEHIGPIDDIPKKYLLGTVRFPLIFLRDRLHESPLNLRNYLSSLTLKENDGN